MPIGGVLLRAKAKQLYEEMHGSSNGFNASCLVVLKTDLAFGYLKSVVKNYHLISKACQNLKKY